MVSQTDSRFDTPLYTLAEAARALDISPSMLATWAKGYVRRRPGKAAVTGLPILTTVAEPSHRGPIIPFVGLAEGMVLAAVRSAGLPMQRVRPALDVLARDIGIDHALASRRLATDGAELLFDYADHADSDEAGPLHELVVVRSGQRMFTETVRQYLQRIDYGDDGYARLIRLPSYDIADVVADPTRAFGQPIFARGGSRVADALGRFWAGEDLQTVSEEFGVPIGQLEDVVRVASRRAA